MRAIKFRMWDKKGNQMRIVSGLDWGFRFELYARSYAIGSRLDEDKYLPDTFHLMQYTGLKDKNGKEIYEGDIVIRDDKKGAWSVKWENKCGGFVSVWGDDWKWIKADYQPAYMVIGNIHENPELLTPPSS